MSRAGQAHWTSMISQKAYSTTTPQKPTHFDDHYLRNRSTLDIGILGYIGIVWPKEHSPEVSHIPPVTLCIKGTLGHKNRSSKYESINRNIISEFTHMQQACLTVQNYASRFQISASALIWKVTLLLWPKPCWLCDCMQVFGILYHSNCLLLFCMLTGLNL